MTSLMKRFVKDESGATAIEYGLIAAGMAVIVLAIFGNTGTVRTVLNTIFQRVTDSIPAAT